MRSFPQAVFSGCLVRYHLLYAEDGNQHRYKALQRFCVYTLIHNSRPIPKAETGLDKLSADTRQLADARKKQGVGEHAPNRHNFGYR